MIGPTGAVRVMMATKPVDFRKGAEGLAHIGGTLSDCVNFAALTGWSADDPESASSPLIVESTSAALVFFSL